MSTITLPCSCEITGKQIWRVNFRFLTFIHDCHTDRVTSASEKNVVEVSEIPRSLNQQNLITSGLYPELKILLSIDKLNR